MNNKKIFLVLLLLVFIVGIMGCGNQISSSKKDWHTLQTILGAFAQKGMNLKPNNSESSNAFELKGIQPAIFTIDKTSDILFIYVFDLFVDQKEADTYYAFDEQDNIKQVPFISKNALIIWKPFEPPNDKESIEKFNKTGNLIADIIFKSLNDGKEASFKGESNHWEATVTLKYYENQWEDENGQIYFQNYQTENHVIRYKMPDVDNVGPVSYEYEAPGPSGNASDLMLDSNGATTAIINGGSFRLDLAKRYYYVTIGWNDKEEKFDLKMPLGSHK